MGSRSHFFSLLNWLKNDGMYYFIKKKVTVFNTNLKKAIVNKEKRISLFLQHCVIIGLPVTPFCHAQSNLGKKEDF